jgi:hypothetical protein
MSVRHPPKISLKADLAIAALRWSFCISASCMKLWPRRLVEWTKITPIALLISHSSIPEFIVWPER